MSYESSHDEFHVFVDAPNGDTSLGWQYVPHDGPAIESQNSTTTDHDHYRVILGPENAGYRAPADPGNPGPRPSILAPYLDPSSLPPGHAAFNTQGFKPRPTE